MMPSMVSKHATLLLLYMMNRLPGKNSILMQSLLSRCLSTEQFDQMGLKDAANVVLQALDSRLKKKRITITNNIKTNKTTDSGMFMLVLGAAISALQQADSGKKISSISYALTSRVADTFSIALNSSEQNLNLRKLITSDQDLQNLKLMGVTFKFSKNETCITFQFDGKKMLSDSKVTLIPVN